MPNTVITIERCDREEHCTVAYNTLVAYSAGAATIEGVLPGKYRISVTHPFTSPLPGKPIEVVATRETTVEAAPAEFRFFGTVTLNGAPIRALLRFASGDATSDETGRYAAALSTNPLTNLITIVACDSHRAYKYTPAQPMQENAPFPIEVRVADLHARVVDDATGSGIPDVHVSFSPIKIVRPDGSTTVFYSSPQAVSEADGGATLLDAPTDRQLIVCATHSDYARFCSPPVTLRSDQTNDVVLRVKRARHGVVQGHAGLGLVSWVDRSGAITEQAVVNSEGHFSFAKEHAPDEAVVYISDRRALSVLTESDSGADATLSLRIPDAPAVSFTVSLDAKGAGAGYVDVWIGSVRVPLQVFASHQEMRGHDVMVSRAHALSVTDIAATAPIAVSFARDREVGGAVFVDPFGLPENANAARVRVLGSHVTLRR